MARTKQTAKKSTGSKKSRGVSKKTKAAENKNHTAKAATDIPQAPCHTPVPGNAAAPFDTPVPPVDAPVPDMHAPCNTPVPVEMPAADDTAADAPVVDDRCAAADAPLHCVTVVFVGWPRTDELLFCRLTKAKQELEEAEKRCSECTNEHLAYVRVPGKRDAPATKDLYWNVIYPAMVDAMKAVDVAKQRIRDLEQC